MRCRVFWMHEKVVVFCIREVGLGGKPHDGRHIARDPNEEGEFIYHPENRRSRRQHEDAPEDDEA